MLHAHLWAMSLLGMQTLKSSFPEALSKLTDLLKTAAAVYTRLSVVSAVLGAARTSSSTLVQELQLLSDEAACPLG